MKPLETTPQIGLLSGSQPQPWIYSPAVDTAFILLPAFVSTALAFVLRNESSAASSESLSLVAWIALILCIDVAHVYGTLFQTYFKPSEWKQNRARYLLVPVLCWVSGALLYSLDALYFWRALAYLAVFHFVRQQYGFFRIYSRIENTRDFGSVHKASSLRQNRFRWLDEAFIYLATLYPLTYWHTHLPRNYHWFIEGDFLEGIPAAVTAGVGFAYSLVAFCYFVKEIQLAFKTHFINIPKQMIILGTAISWYTGIVVFNGDLIFTLTNVVSHGIPYMALVWISGRKAFTRANAPSRASPSRIAKLFTWRWIPLYLGFLLVLAFFEEGIWDGLIWRDHLEFFTSFKNLPVIRDHGTLTWLIPLLALPQSTHYVLDGFIWKLKTPLSQGRRSTEVSPL